MRQESVALFQPDRHEPLTATAWDESAARAAIARIVEEVHSAYRGETGLWPIHPIDVSPERANPLKLVYYGAAGVIWTLHHLHGSGLAEVGRDYAPVFDTLLANHRRDALQLGPNLTGDAGILLMHWKLAPSERAARDLHEVIQSNMEHPALGFVAGGAGTMLNALFMFEQTGDGRWRDLYLSSFEALWRRWKYDEETCCHLWTMELHGHRARHIGGLHGLAGIVACMLRGRALLTPQRHEELVRRAREAMSVLAVRDGCHANWPLAVGNVPHPHWRTPLLQHCWGAPGYVNCLAGLCGHPETDALLRAAGELIWHAGPVTKLPSLCHGVPGSGYAFLKLFTCTGDAMWLDRARAFAMHGIEQGERFERQYGQRKFSLWTGDLGLAVFLGDCIQGRSNFPTLDVF